MQAVLQSFLFILLDIKLYSLYFFTKGGLQIHFLLPSEGAYANFRIVSNPTPTPLSSSSGSERTVPHVTLQMLPLSNAARGDALD